jgi:hypothetical protein
VLVYRQQFTLEDAIGSRGYPLLLLVHTVNCVQTLKGIFRNQSCATAEATTSIQQSNLIGPVYTSSAGGAGGAGTGGTVSAGGGAAAVESEEPTSALLPPNGTVTLPIDEHTASSPVWAWHGARVRQKFTLEDAIGSQACSLEASRRVTNGILLGCPLFLPVDTVNCVQTLKAQWDRLCSRCRCEPNLGRPESGLVCGLVCIPER